jgi:hypothetical protein
MPRRRLESCRFWSLRRVARIGVRYCSESWRWRCHGEIKLGRVVRLRIDARTLFLQREESELTEVAN